MEKVTHNIEHEQKLIELLGFSLIGPDNSNRWIIEDEHHNSIGFVQYKKVSSKNAKKKISEIYGYHTEINNQDIHYEKTRKTDNSDTEFSYKLDIKRKNGDIDHLEFNIGEYPNLTLWSTQYGFMTFRVDMNGLFLNFKSRTENFNLEETVRYQINDKKYHHSTNEYTYQINYCDKDTDLNNDYAKGIKSRAITGKSTLEQQANNEIQITENTWANNRLVKNRETIVTGTIEEMIEKHEMGIDAFSHFRFLVNQILPFKQEVISAIFGKNYFNQEVISAIFGKNHCENLSLFIPELEKEPFNKQLKENYKLAKEYCKSKENYKLVKEYFKF